MKRNLNELLIIVLSLAIIMCATVITTTMVERTIFATVNGNEITLNTNKYTVEKALEDAGISYCEDDYLSVIPQAYVYDKMKIELVHATDFTVTADGETKAYKSLEKTVGAALTEEKIKVGEIDIVEPAADKPLKQNAHIVVKRVVKEEEKATVDVDFKTEVSYTSDLEEGKSKVAKEGKKGKANVVYEVTYTDGKETARKELSRKVVQDPVNEKVLKGTAVAFEGVLYKKKLTVRAYSYTGGGRTASGTRARVGEIAVDPRVIPLGTTVYIPGIGKRRAEDTGGNIKGNTIDIYMSSMGACRSWGVRTITIYIK